MRKRDKMLGKPRILSLFQTRFINSIKHEHSCKILYENEQKESEYIWEMPQSHITDQPMAHKEDNHINQKTRWLLYTGYFTWILFMRREGVPQNVNPTSPTPTSTLGISYLDIRQPFCSAECSHLCNYWGTIMWNKFEFGSKVQEQMLFKRFLICSSGGPPVGGVEPFMQICKRASWGTFMWSCMKFGPMVQEKLFKDFSYLELYQPFCSMDCNHLCNIGRRHHEEQSCEIILN